MWFLKKGFNEDVELKIQNIPGAVCSCVRLYVRLCPMLIFSSIISNQVSFCIVNFAVYCVPFAFVIIFFSLTSFFPTFHTKEANSTCCLVCGGMRWHAVATRREIYLPYSGSIRLKHKKNPWVALESRLTTHDPSRAHPERFLVEFYTKFRRNYCVVEVNRRNNGLFELALCKLWY